MALVVTCRAKVETLGSRTRSRRQAASEDGRTHRPALAERLCFRKDRDSSKKVVIAHEFVVQQGAPANPAAALPLQFRHFDRRVAEFSPLGVATRLS